MNDQPTGREAKGLDTLRQARHSLERGGNTNHSLLEVGTNTTIPSFSTRTRRLEEEDHKDRHLQAQERITAV
jgi:hypothetical protein